MSTIQLPFFDRLQGAATRQSLQDSERRLSYADLLAEADRVAAHLLAMAGSTTNGLEGARVAFLVEPSCIWASLVLGIWRAGGVAVPLALQQPPPELAYTVDDSGASLVVAGPSFVERLRRLAEERELPFLVTRDLIAPAPPVDLPALFPGQGALVLYTSGTTGRPKGVVLTHGNLQAQVENLVEAWAWTAEDRIVDFLPLHHLHGIVNILFCALWSGARCEMMARFDADAVWQRIASGRLTLLMAVPTIYHRLISAWEAQGAARREELSAACRGLRLMVSGSAALPVPTLERWREISGHTLLERYGMTEIGMALSNPLDGERVPGAVGSPLPKIEVRLVDPEGAALGDSVSGEIEVRGPTVFGEYLGRPEATHDAFRGGWFRTGDVAVREDGVYRILGRQSVDIIKTGGEKVSALEIEAVLREHPAILDCAVVGVPDVDWGERVAAAVICAAGESVELEALRTWARERLAIYKVPSRILEVEDLPRNAMGKVQKPAVVELFGASRS